MADSVFQPPEPRLPEPPAPVKVALRHTRGPAVLFAIAGLAILVACIAIPRFYGAARRAAPSAIRTTAGALDPAVSLAILESDRDDPPEALVMAFRSRLNSLAAKCTDKGLADLGGLLLWMQKQFRAQGHTIGLLAIASDLDTLGDTAESLGLRTCGELAALWVHMSERR